MAAVACNATFSESYSGSALTSMTLTETLDTHGFIDPGDPTIITIPQTGWYLLWGVSQIPNRGGGYDLWLLDGATVVGINQFIKLGNYGGSSAVWAMRLNAGQTIEFQTSASGSSAQTVSGQVQVIRLPGNDMCLATGTSHTGAGVVDLTGVRDPMVLHDDVTNPSRITVDEDGLYLYVGVCYVDAGSDSLREANIRVNGSNVHEGKTAFSNGNPSYEYVPTAGVLNLTAGDYVEVYSEDDAAATMLLIVKLGADAIAAHATQTSGSSITASGAIVTFDSETVDTDSFHSTSSNTSRLTIPFDGIYMILGSVEMVGIFGMWGALIDSDDTWPAWHAQAWRVTNTGTIGGTGGKTATAQVCEVANRTASDYYELAAGHDDGTARNTQIAGTFLSAVNIDGWTYESFVPQIYRRT